MACSSDKLQGYHKGIFLVTEHMLRRLPWELRDTIYSHYWADHGKTIKTLHRLIPIICKHPVEKPLPFETPFILYEGNIRQEIAAEALKWFFENTIIRISWDLLSTFLHKHLFRVGLAVSMVKLSSLIVEVVITPNMYRMAASFTSRDIDTVRRELLRLTSAVTQLLPRELRDKIFGYLQDHSHVDAFNLYLNTYNESSPLLAVTDPVYVGAHFTFEVRQTLLSQKDYEV
ncbi:hypothetical protein P154DRAFT_577467 [Amniculicola lignicola CBS 123094]|uniref:Uncharacterized protein n=1 Tax=Amniculicola lignicola CBS 123094 TaxID=1392246 RepID=A0A6A5WMI9_9PLEO|nr:hypothetical protein P154DRAFT_577467 [Amniculicola lignicola CBS 123094]